MKLNSIIFCLLLPLLNGCDVGDHRIELRMGEIEQELLTLPTSRLKPPLAALKLSVMTAALAVQPAAMIPAISMVFGYLLNPSRLIS